MPINAIDVGSPAAAADLAHEIRRGDRDVEVHETLVLHAVHEILGADHVGNAALGYSTSNGTSPNFPSIAYSGRLETFEVL